MALSEGDRQRGVGKISTIYPRIEGSFNLDVPASKQAPKSISEIVQSAAEDLMAQGAPDPWDTDRLGSSYRQRFEGNPRRLLKTHGEHSASFTQRAEEKKPITPMNAEEKETAMNLLKWVYQKLGVDKPSRTKELTRFKLCCDEGTIGKEALDVISKIVETLGTPKPAPVTQVAK